MAHENHRGQVRKWHVLVVDDEPDSLEVASRILTYHGATVHTANSGREALDSVKECPPTFILMDLSMPDMDGWETLHALKEDLHTAPIPVVALTAHAMKGDRERAVSAGFDYYLTKPISPATFLDDLLKLFTEPPVTPCGSDPRFIIGQQ